MAQATEKVYSFTSNQFRQGIYLSDHPKHLVKIHKYMCTAQGPQLTCETYGEEKVMLALSVLSPPLFTNAYSLITYSLPQCQLKQRPFLTAV